MDDLIEVRADETFDVAALVDWTCAQSGLPEGTPAITQFAGGKANLTYLLKYPDDSELVLRRPPLGPVATSSHDMAREHRVLSKLWQSFELAPRAVGYCDDPSIIGAPFFLMERREGVVVRGSVPSGFGGGEDPVANQSLSEVVVDTLAQLHSIDLDECGLGDLGHPDGFLERQVTGWTRRWENAKHEENLLADDLAAWLMSELPGSNVVTLLHNDWRLDNMAVSPEDPGVCTAVYDWDMATRGDPLADVGTLMASWFDPGEAPDSLGMMPTTTTGWLDRKTAVERYGSASGARLDHIDWYLVFGSWKLAVVLQQIYIRWRRGQTKDQRFQSLDDGARHLLRLADERRN